MTKEECIEIERRYKKAMLSLPLDEKNAIHDCLVHGRTESNYEEVVPTIWVMRLIADLYDIKKRRTTND